MFINYIKLFPIFFLLALLSEVQGQVCTDQDGGNNWNNSWTSCKKSANPNSDRPRSHWLLYEFDEPQSIDLSHIWNANRKGESNLGIKEAIIDYSIDGKKWTNLGTFSFPKGNEKNNYKGFDGPDFGGAFVSKVLITVSDTYGDGECASLAEVQFNINPEACYGEVDACGVCNGEGPNTWYIDQDGDGLGSPETIIESCEQPEGYVSNANDDCDTGIVGWATVGPIFQENGCTGCHGNGAAGGLNLTTYSATVQGGHKCGPGILTGTTLIDIITTDDYAGCGDPFIGPSMNTRVGGQIDEEELALIKKWVEDGAPEDCSCPAGSPDSDNDGVCDAVDSCPNIDNTLIGTACDDGSDCTTNDIWTEDCNCAGTLIDRDNDGVCDTEDAAPDNPCTADGLVDGIEPANWVPHPDNDCDLDEISVASGDLNDFSACIDKEGTLSTPECNCGENLVDAGGEVIDFMGMSLNEAKAAGGRPDGLFTENITHNQDTLYLQFPFMEEGEQICLTLGFSSGNGTARLFLNNRLMTFTGERDLNNYQPQQFCFETFNSGLQTLIITEDGSGDLRVDGTTYSTCPCDQSGNNGDVTELACQVNYPDIGWRQLDNCILEVCEGQQLALGTDRYESIIYQWRGPNGLNTESATLSFDAVKPLDSGLYWLYYRNTSGCDLIKTIELRVLAAPPVTPQIRQPSCGINNGEIVLRFEDDPDRANIQFSIAGENGNYLEVADNLGSYIYSNLSEGTYDVWARWSGGECLVNIGVFTLTDQPGPDLEAGPNHKICEGESVTLFADASGNNLNYRWSNGSRRARQKVTPIPDAYADQRFVYRVTVTDENGCTDRDRVVVDVKSKLQAVVNIDHPKNGNENGAITFVFADHPNHKTMEISIDGETGNYQKVPDNSGSYTFKNLQPGTYNAWIRWSEGECPVNIGRVRLKYNEVCPEIKAAVSERVICEGESVRLTVNKGSGWRYIWSNGSTKASQVVRPELEDYANEIKTYAVTVTDKNGCSQRDEIEVKVISRPQVKYSLSNAHCDKADGSITFSFADHPDQKYILLSINGKDGKYRRVEDAKGSSVFNRLRAGRYQLWVKWRKDGCPVNLGTVKLENEPGPEIRVTPDRVLCEGQSIKLSVNKKNGWTYRWSNGVKKRTQTIKRKVKPYDNQIATYGVTVTDRYGCKATDQVKVTMLSKPRAKVQKVNPFCGRSDGAIIFTFKNHKDQRFMEFSINGRNGKYRRVKDNTGMLRFNNLPAGRYNAFVRWGDDSCPVSLGRIVLEDRPGPVIDAGPDLIVCEGRPINLRVNKRKDWDIRWNNGAKTHKQVIPTKAAGKYANRYRTYKVRVTDKNRCRATDEVKVVILSKPRVKISHTDAHCDQSDGTINFTFKDHPDERYLEFSINGKDGPYRRVRDDRGAFTFNKLAAGRYDVWVRWWKKGCPLRLGWINIRNLPGLQIDAGKDQVVCEGDPVILSVEENKNWRYRWSNGNRKASQTIVPKMADFANQTFTYTIDATDEFRCKATDEVNVQVISKPRAKIEKRYHPSCGKADGEIMLTFEDHPDQKSIEFSIDGEKGKYRRVRDELGTFRFSKLKAGKYSVWVRWPGNSCAYNLSEVELKVKEEDCNSSVIIADKDEDLQDPVDAVVAPPQEDKLNIQNNIKSDPPFESVARTELLVFPNPAAAGSSVTIKYYTEKPVAPLRITDLAGKLIKVIDVSLIQKGWNEIPLDSEYLSTGTYIVMDGYGLYERFVIVE